MHRAFSRAERVVARVRSPQRSPALCRTQRHIHANESKDTWENGDLLQRGTKVYVGMSGGVDSSVAASLLKDQGHDVEAIFMRNWDTRDERGECPSERDYRDVQSVCSQLEIKCHQISLVKEYWNAVFAVALDGYARGLTPNPDVLCNSEIKFGVLLNHINQKINQGKGERGWWFATGHYACAMRGRFSGGSVQLYRGADRRKDQSYYLSAVPAASLDRVVFPLGNLSKSRDVRRIAREKDLTTASKDESMGICFVGERRKFDAFLAEYIPQKQGDVLSSDGLKLGTHRGIFTKTIGQSAGISGWHDKWYIYAKDLDRNRMYAVQDRNHPLLHKKTVRVGPVHWISGAAPLGIEQIGGISLEAQVRYMQEPQKCTLSADQSGNGANAQGGGYLRVEFQDPQFGVASGQYLVIYNGDHCLGSATIR